MASLEQKIFILALTFPLLYLALVALGRWLRRKRSVSLGLMYHLFAIAVAVYVPVEWLSLTFPGSAHLAPAVILLGTFFVIALLRRFLEFYFHSKRQIEIPKFLGQVVALLIFLVAVLLVLSQQYGVRIPATLLTGSGILALILGLAMQDMLGNIFSGFAIHFGKPFRVGDWLILENRHAEVMEINWRSTRLRTNDNVYLDVPNSQIAKQTITNLNFPDRLHAMRLQVGLDYNAPPNRVKEALIHATVNAAGVLPQPPPKVFLNAFGDSSIIYEVKFWMEDHSQYNDIVDAIRTNIWYELHRHHIKIPFPIRTLQIERPAQAHQQASRAKAHATLRHQPLFQCLTDAQVDTLLARAAFEHFGRGEKLIEQGQEGESMFILVRGQANVVVSRNGESTAVASLRGGDCLGEMSLLTGETRSATVIAQTDCEVVEIDKPIMEELLQTTPDLLPKLSELLAKRRMETEGALAETAAKQTVLAKQQEYTEGFLARLRTFFEL